MIALTNNQIVRIWELAQQQHPVDQAITILYKAFSDKTWDELVRFPIGDRNNFLLDIREATFGKELSGMAKCTECDEQMEFIADVDELRFGSDTKKQQDVYEAIFGHYKIRLRLINSLDLAAAAGCPDANSGGKLLAQRVVLKLIHNNTEISADKLPDESLSVISEKLAKADPEANMNIDMKCPECSKELSMPFDIVIFFWKEIFFGFLLIYMQSP